MRNSERRCVTGRCLAARGNEKKGLGKRLGSPWKCSKLCRGMSLVRSELPRWSVKYWRNKLHSWWGRASFFSPFAGLDDILLFDDDSCYDRDETGVDETSLTTIVKPTSRRFVGEGFGDIRGSWDEENFSLTGCLAAFRGLRDVLIWKYSMQERGAINGRLLPPRLYELVSARGVLSGHVEIFNVMVAQLCCQRQILDLED